MYNSYYEYKINPKIYIMKLKPLENIIVRYNFKKIAVKNRTQAVSWANDNLRR